MHALTIEGVQVLFPFEPYDIQLEYMKSVIKCLQEKSNGLLESPTGTGKTLCLLCSVLGWLDSLQASYMKQMLDKRMKVDETGDYPVTGMGFGQQLPKILYSSRTHSQLSQACKELKNTAYTSFKTVVIGSRDQLCIHPDVTKLDSNWAKNQMCKAKTTARSCTYYNGYETKVERDEGFTSTQVFDIEDLVTLGRKHNCCPYYAARHIRNRAALIFTPYNYILDPQIRKSNSLELKDSVVIFDEGHNIEKICEESVSSELRSDTFALCIQHLDSVLKTLKEIHDKTYQGLDSKEYEELNIVEIAKAKMMICDLETEVDSLIKSSPTNKTNHETKIIFDLMKRTGYDAVSCNIIMSVLDKTSQLLNATKAYTASQNTAISSALENLSDFIERLIPIHSTSFIGFESYKADVIKKFKVFSERGGEEENAKSTFWTRKSDPNSWVLHLWCMSPSIGAKALTDIGIHSIIITSGTLTPIDSFDVEMDTPFAVKLQNSHIIKGNQLAIFNMSNARDGTILTSKYDNRNNLQYIKALGQTLMDVMAVIPKGMLVFFSSYTALNKCIDVWKGSSNLWNRMNSVKQIFLEPRRKESFNDCINKYKCKVDEMNSSGAAFYAVCRGKLSEGIDLPDDYCRCVIMTGLPFPPVAEPRVILKKQYLAEAKTKLTPDGWYTLQMKRALNQSIGRVIRHKDDYGVIILMDSRFAFMREGLSKWVEKYIHKNRGKSFNDYIRELSQFFSTKCPHVSRPPKQEFNAPSKPLLSHPTGPSGIFAGIKKKKKTSDERFDQMMTDYSVQTKTQPSEPLVGTIVTANQLLTESNQSIVRSSPRPSPKSSQRSIFDYITID